MRLFLNYLTCYTVRAVDLNENALQCSSVLYVFGHFIVGRSVSKPLLRLAENSARIYRGVPLDKTNCLYRQWNFAGSVRSVTISILHINRLFNFRSRGEKLSLFRDDGRKTEEFLRGNGEHAKIQRYRRARRVFCP